MSLIIIVLTVVQKTYCPLITLLILIVFQDLNLRGDPVLITDPVVYNNSTNQYETGVNITRGTNSFVVFEKRGVVFSTSPNPIFDGDNSSDPFYEEKVEA